MNCSGLTSVTLGNSVTKIGDLAFFCCSNLASINIPESVTSIGDQAFYACYSLTSINIPSSLTNIGLDAFTICSGLTSISVEEGNTVYDSRDNCNAIIVTAKDEMIVACKNTTFPKSVKSIAKAAFNYLDITSFKLPKTVAKIDGSPVYRCPELASIVVEEGNTMFDSRDNCNAIIETSSNTLIAGCKNTIIPNSVTGIGDQAFIGCTNLESIVIPNSVTAIGSQAFSGCTKLESIVIPNSVTMINYGTFEGCTNLKSVTIGDKVTYIDMNAFGRIGNDDCSALTSVTILTKIPPTIYSIDYLDTFTTYGTLHVLPGCKAAYEAVDGWNKFTIVEDAVDPAMNTPEATAALIDAIGEVEYTESCKAKIDAARAAYDALTKEQQALVSNLSVLIAAEEAYDKLAKMTTAISNVATDNVQNDGKYVVNGKVVIVKNGRKYNMNGLSE